MENNEENLEKNVSEETTTSTGASNVVAKIMEKKKIIGIVAIVLIVIALFFGIFTRSAKDAGKNYVKAYLNAKASKLDSLYDYDGAAAFAKLTRTYNSDTKEYEYNFDKFDEFYEDVLKANKDLDSDQKKEIKDKRKDAIDDLQESLTKMKDYYKEEGIKWSVKEVKTYNVKDAKKLTKVKVKVELKKDGETETETVTLYTMKKGLKNYVVYAEGMNI